jgi:hypothetical protein
MSGFDLLLGLDDPMAALGTYLIGLAVAAGGAFVVLKYDHFARMRDERRSRERHL